MRRVDRSQVAPPDVLVAPDGRGARELAEARAFFQNGTGKAPSYAAYSHDQVKAALEALFHGKCAYCETRYDVASPVDVEHFRPKGRVQDAPDHPGYWWLAMVWTNLLPSCIDCNRRRRQLLPDTSAGFEEMARAARVTETAGKQDAFPVSATRALSETDDLDAEAALLIDPTRDRPEDHLTYLLEPGQDLPLILPLRDDQGNLSPRAIASIQIHGLNRLGLLQARVRVLRQLEFLRLLVHDLDELARELGRSRAKAAKAAVPRVEAFIDRILHEIEALGADDQPYSTMVRQWITRWQATL